MDQSGDLVGGTSVELTLSLAERFQRRAVELARSGTLGNLKTRKASLQVAYGHFVGLLDNPTVPVLVYGEVGSGKKRLVEEYLVLHNFYRKMEGLPAGALRVLRGDFVAKGFTQQLLTPSARTADIVYLERIDLLTEELQKELLEHLRTREDFAERGVIMPRLVLGTEKALSMMVLRKEFSRDLFQAITGFAIFLPSLNERAEDLPQLISTFIHKLSGQAQVPSRAFVDFVSRQLWAHNFDDLERVIKNLLAKKADARTWTDADMPEMASSFAKANPKDVTQNVKERVKVRQLLIKAGGDRVRAAHLAGLSRGDFLKKLFQLGLR